MLAFRINVLSLLLLVLLSKYGQSFVIREPINSINQHDVQRWSVQQDSAIVGSKTLLAAEPPAAADEWKERAARLRQEIQDYEALQSKKKGLINTREQPTAVETPETIDDSTWRITYRFILGADEEETKNNNNEENDQRESFGGTVNIKFRSDGYTDLVSQQASGGGDQGATIVKAWGWDIETSAEENDQQYLLFSMDFQFPKQNRPGQRLYFQARHSRSSASGVELAEGTITVKKDVIQKNAARWALFSPAGILAQFRYAGNFVAKPAR
jgi:hypothetical protein